ncbi:MAG: SprT family zinc-dependent metalloprotease [Bdellovibrionota bacterium]
MEAVDYESITFGREKIQFSLVRRPRKTLGINVHPDMSIEVIAPEDATIPKIHSKVRKRAPWILKQQEYFYQFMPATPPRKYISGETHKYLGRQYRLKIHKSALEVVKLKGQFLHVYTADKKNTRKIKRLLDGWYREKAKERFDLQIHKLLPKFSKYSISVPQIELKKMPKRWGSCHINGKITLNPDLIKAPSQCIEYVLMHELCHLIEPSHSQKYYRLLKRMMRIGRGGKRNWRGQGT